MSVTISLAYREQDEQISALRTQLENQSEKHAVLNRELKDSQAKGELAGMIEIEHLSTNADGNGEARTSDFGFCSDGVSRCLQLC